MGLIKAIPEGYTIYDKVIVNGPLTIQQLFDEMKTRFNVDVDMITVGDFVLIGSHMNK